MAEKQIAENRRARHDYHFLDRFEAGLVLNGSEVKSLRQGHAVLQRAYADARDGELWLVGLHIPPYEQASVAPHDPDRDRKLLLHRREIDRLSAQVAEKGLTVVPTRLYFKDGRAKVELALARGKEGRDKRRDIADRESKRRIDRELKAGGAEGSATGTDGGRRCYEEHARERCDRPHPRHARLGLPHASPLTA